MVKSKIIYGCDSRGDGDSPYLTRWTLLETKHGNLYLHKFHRSDSPEEHDHPWNFWSIVLWPGYREMTPLGSFWRWPLIPAFRPATWRHRVMLFPVFCLSCQCTGFASYGIECVRCAGRGMWERTCWTLVFAGPKVREWGFFTKAGWQNWRDYFTERGC